MSREVTQRFEYHPADTQDKKDHHEAVREMHLDLARWIEGAIPESRERAQALTALQESMMWCNAAVAYRSS
jgi:hypothetical protein